VAIYQLASTGGLFTKHSHSIVYIIVGVNKV
jgi:hypothetical protein